MKSIIKSIASLKLFFDLPDSIFAISSDKSSASYITFKGLCTGVQNRSVSISTPLFTSSGFFTSSLMFLFTLAILILLLYAKSAFPRPFSNNQLFTDFSFPDRSGCIRVFLPLRLHCHRFRFCPDEALQKAVHTFYLCFWSRPACPF